ncbi:MAG: hypothetical protein AW09_004613 [Candidatus Accumulibacter phosphatis]|uniref:Uncharacterized protein n=1 Tax=Candidatus Accumulibacter phosphatis TaxID=327160 RepID=A0A084Y6G5_9PROT|nr:MAG: hypothetical protein AW09_004613 [Candidatus Accumulibacter phosphatis]
MFSLVMMNEKSTALVMMYRSIADMFAELSSTRATSFIDRSWYTKTATKKA